MSRITDFFNNLKKQREESQAFRANFKQLAENVRQGDLAAVNQNYDAVAASILYNVDKKNALLRAALATDNKDIFIKIVDRASPDIWFYSSSPPLPDGPFRESKDHILTMAIEQGRENIAPYLAKHPAVDVLAQSSSMCMRYRNGHTETQKDITNSPFILASQAGMRSVVEAIADRVVELTSNRGAAKPSR